MWITAQTLLLQIETEPCFYFLNKQLFIKRLDYVFSEKTFFPKKLESASRLATGQCNEELKTAERPENFRSILIHHLSVFLAMWVPLARKHLHYVSTSFETINQSNTFLLKLQRGIGQKRKSTFFHLQRQMYCFFTDVSLGHLRFYPCTFRW